LVAVVEPAVMHLGNQPATADLEVAAQAQLIQLPEKVFILAQVI
jgi:hypothetical protein